MENKIDLDQDLALYYPGGSGGFLFFYILLLFKKHIVGYDLNVLNQFKQQISNFKINKITYCCEKTYRSLAGLDWPNFHDYVNNNYKVNQDIQSELDSLKHKFIKNEIKFNYTDNYELLMDNINLLIDYQWQGKQNYWKDLELQPNNSITKQIQSSKYKNKIYFYRFSTMDEWKKFKGKKILFYVDFNTQIRMSLYKKAKWFDKHDLGENRRTKMSDVKNVINSTKIINGLSQEVVDLLPYADYTATLPQLLYNIQDIFVGKINTQQLDLLQHWISLHPEKLLKKTNLI